MKTADSEERVLTSAGSVQFTANTTGIWWQILRPLSRLPPANGRYSSITVFEVCDRLNQPLRYHCFGSMFGFDLWPGTLSEVRKIIFTLNITVRCTRPYYKVVLSDQQHCSLRFFMRLVTLGRWHWGTNAGWGRLRIGCWGEYLGLGGTR